MCRPSIVFFNPLAPRGSLLSPQQKPIALEPDARHTGHIFRNIDEFEAIVLPKQMEAFAIHKLCDPKNILARTFALLSELLVNP